MKFIPYFLFIPFSIDGKDDHGLVVSFLLWQKAQPIKLSMLMIFKSAVEFHSENHRP